MEFANTTDDKSMNYFGDDALDLLEIFEEASDDKFGCAAYEQMLNDEPDLALPQEKNDG